MAVETPQYAVPFRVANGKVAEVEQDSPEEIAQCVEAVLQTEIGSWLDEPDFGRPDETFSQLTPTPSAEPYLDAVAEWEPRAHLLGEAGIEDLTKRVVLRSNPE